MFGPDARELFVLGYRRNVAPAKSTDLGGGLDEFRARWAWATILVHPNLT
jgi:hypothetical protein